MILVVLVYIYSLLLEIVNNLYIADITLKTRTCLCSWLEWAGIHACLTECTLDQRTLFVVEKNASYGCVFFV
jgi:hypothetical protein